MADRREWRRLGVGGLAVVAGLVGGGAMALVYTQLLAAAMFGMVVVAGAGLLADRPRVVAGGFGGVALLALLIGVATLLGQGGTALGLAMLVLAVVAGYRGGQYARAAGIA